MTKYIATKLHKAIELAPDEEFFAHCATLPHYVIDPTLTELLARSDVQASVRAMVEAGIARLPFAEMLLELPGAGDLRHFVVLAETAGQFTATCGALKGEQVAEVSPPYRLELRDAEIRVNADRRSHEAWMYISAMALGVALLMLNIQGVEKEIIAPVKLNKSRVASGKLSIPTHSVMRIGHVYDSDGNRVGMGTGRQMPVHMRAGHARRQHYGEGNLLEKIVYIPPVLVNFKPGESVKVPKRVLAA